VRIFTFFLSTNYQHRIRDHAGSIKPHACSIPSHHVTFMLLQILYTTGFEFELVATEYLCYWGTKKIDHFDTNIFPNHCQLASPRRNLVAQFFCYAVWRTVHDLNNSFFNRSGVMHKSTFWRFKRMEQVSICPHLGQNERLPIHIHTKPQKRVSIFPYLASGCHEIIVIYI